MLITKSAEEIAELVSGRLVGTCANALQGVASLSEATETDVYDVVGPVCESSDVFGHELTLPLTQRGDLIALRSAGAYGESMASTYNMRRIPDSHFTD